MNWIKTHTNFLARLISLAVILVALAVYQNTATGWAALQAENDAAIAEVEAYNAEIQAQQAALDAAANGEEAAEVASTWIDGSYTGSGVGFGGTITVTVTIEGDAITNISIDSAANEDNSYLATAMAIVDNILKAQSADVDTISGATFSSTGIREAVTAALEQAVNNG